MDNPVPRALTHPEKLGIAYDPSVNYWRGYYAGDPSGAEPIGAERLGMFRDALASVNARGVWLDAGCGIGMIARQFRESGLRVCGIDMSAALLDEAQRVTGLELVAPGQRPPRDEHLYRAPVERTPYDDEQFDGVYSSSVLEYVADLELALTEFHRVVRTGGHLVFNLPNAFSAFRMAYAVLRRRSRYFQLVPRWAYWKWEIARLLERSGWEQQMFTYYGCERQAPGLPEWIPARVRRPLATQPWAASFVLIVARKVGTARTN